MKQVTIILLFLVLAFNIIAQTEKKTSNENLLGITTLSVTIGGSFIVAGTFPALITERVDQFVTRIYNQARENALSFVQDEQTAERMKKKLDNYALRGIKLKRSFGEELTLDLIKFRNSGDFVNNPYLKNDDVLIFPPYDIERNFFVIDGAVKKRGKYLFVEGDKISDAIELAMGLDPAYENLEEIKVTRLSYDGKDLEELTYSIDQRDVPIQRGDRIKIIADETQKRDFKVLVIGEVKQPGYVYITKANTTLFEVIRNAGGFTENADLNRADLLRGTNIFAYVQKDIIDKAFDNRVDYENILYAAYELTQNPRDLMMERMSHLIEEDTVYFMVDNMIRTRRADIHVDFSMLYSDTTLESKTIVRDNDIIIVPDKRNLVYVFGQVSKAGYLPFEEGKGYNHYITQAGGLGEEAREEVYLIKGKTREWINATKKEVNIEAGDYIWIPKKTPRTFWFYLEQIGQATSIIGAVATIALLITQLSK
jgi:protein involved in polysaccharide export with SLBB domain